MRILYLSAHEVLHFDEISLLNELGHEVFCPGAAVCSENAGDQGVRPGLHKCENYDALMEEWHTFGKAGHDNKENISTSFFKKFDLVWIMHIPLWISSNWERMKAAGVPVMVRTIGQNLAHNEAQLLPYRKEGLKIVRYSPKEENIPGYVGKDALIRFYKDPAEFSGWTGHINEVMTIAQSMERRGPPCNFKYFQDVTAPFPRKLFGTESESLPYGMGKVPYNDLKQAMRDHRVFLYTGTWPASLTLGFIEAFMSGIPMVCIGASKGDPHGWAPGLKLYEVADIIKNGVNGFCSDSFTDSQDFIRKLLSDHEFAKKIGAAGRETAIHLFGKKDIKNQWDLFLREVRC